MSGRWLESAVFQRVTALLFETGKKNEKYIYLDFAWIFGAVDWIESWIDIVLSAVVLVARPFLLSARLYRAFSGLVAGVIV